MTKQKLLELTNDYTFKKIFGYAGDEEITKVFLEDILNEEIRKIKLDSNTITEKELYTDKAGVMDVKAYLNDGCPCDIEVQVVKQEDIEKRILFYWAKNYTKTIEQGQDYGELKRSIVVLIADFKINILSKIPKYYTKWHIREDEYTTSVLTDALEILIIELPKVKRFLEKNKNKKINLWVKFIRNPEVFDMSEIENDKELEKTREAIKKAKKKLDEISQDEHERYLAELRDKYIRDQKAVQKYGYNCGLREGKLKVAKKMLEQGIERDIICNVTELTEEDLQLL